ncbi:endonuclease [Ruminococcus albus SY3]|uniref:Endonuclease n=1 Tax=Ruminococcus albus SY3 TaxID=1341156 RepID=A0A011VQV9_RUMAL|nr:phage holin [Ruminococcus albus]EXM37641.1 endonuclease [Ruminococcus albus SY3]
MKDIIMQIIPIVLATVGTFLIGLIKAKYSQYVNTDTKKEIAMLTVRYVEQVFTALHGKDKLEKAKSTFVEMLNEKGIEVSEAEINMLLEAAVHQMNERKGVDK